MSGIFRGSDGETAELLKALESFYTKEGIEFKSDLSKEEIVSIFQGKIIDNYITKMLGLSENETFDLIDALVWYMSLKVSDKRLGRKEGVQVMKAQVEKEQRMRDQIGKLMGIS